MEGSKYSALLREHKVLKSDLDVMFNVLWYKKKPLNVHEQEISFKHLPNKPGHLHILINDADNWSLGEMNRILKIYQEEINDQLYLSALKLRKIWSHTAIYTKHNGFPVFLIDSDPIEGKASVSYNIGQDVNLAAKEGIDKIVEFISNIFDIDRDAFRKTIDDIVMNIYQTNPAIKKRFDSFLTFSDDASAEQFLKISSNLVTTEHHVDLVPSIRCDSWPVIANEWKIRNRFWPPKFLIDKIVNAGYHVVPKNSPGGDTVLEWRISFSKAELALAENRTHVQKKCYYIFKTMFKEYFQEFDIVTTYYLKTIMMWAMEQNPPEYWIESNIGRAVLGLLDDLYEALITGYLPHYFIPQNNLLKRFPAKSLSNDAQNILSFRKAFTDINRIELPDPIGNETAVQLSINQFKKIKAEYIEANIRQFSLLLKTCSNTSDDKGKGIGHINPECFFSFIVNTSQVDEEYLVKLFPGKTNLIKLHYKQVREWLHLIYEIIIYFIQKDLPLEEFFSRYVVNLASSGDLEEGFSEFLHKLDRDDDAFNRYKEVLIDYKKKNMKEQQFRDHLANLVKYIMSNETLIKRIEPPKAWEEGIKEQIKNSLGQAAHREGLLSAMKNQFGDSELTDVVHKGLQRQGIKGYKHNELYDMVHYIKKDKQLIKTLLSHLPKARAVMGKFLLKGVKNASQLRKEIKITLENFPKHLHYHVVDEMKQIFKKASMYDDDDYVKILEKAENHGFLNAALEQSANNLNKESLLKGELVLTVFQAIL